VAHGKIGKKEKPTANYVVDTDLTMRDINERTYQAINLLAPYGVENPKPHFLFRRVAIERIELFGKEKNHLKLFLRGEEGGSSQAIGFFMAEKSFPHIDLAVGVSIDLIATLEKSFFRGRPELRLRIVEVL
jgi:single-stranded-DNA-specific exonuclease